MNAFLVEGKWVLVLLAGIINGKPILDISLTPFHKQSSSSRMQAWQAHYILGGQWSNAQFRSWHIYAPFVSIPFKLAALSARDFFPGWLVTHRGCGLRAFHGLLKHFHSAARVLTNSRIQCKSNAFWFSPFSSSPNIQYIPQSEAERSKKRLVQPISGIQPA